MNSTAASIIFFTSLVEDSQKELDFITADPTLPDRDKLLVEYTNNLTTQKARLDYLKSVADPTTLKQDIEEWIKEIETWFDMIKQWLPESVVKFFQTLLDIAHKILNELP